MLGRTNYCLLNCGSKGIRRNGTRIVRGVRVQQYVCKSCGGTWIAAIDPALPLGVFLALRVPIPKALKIVAMFATGLPMNHIGRLLKVKGDTVKTCILRLTSEVSWEEVRELISRKFRISRSELEELGDLPIELDFQPMPFRGRALAFRRLAVQQRRNILRRAGRIAKRQLRF
jgi:transposase-like protein